MSCFTSKNCVYRDHLAHGSLGTSISPLHNTWQTVAQIQADPANGYLADAAFVEDKEVASWIEKDGYEDQLVGIKMWEDGEKTEITVIRRRVVDGQE